MLFSIDCLLISLLIFIYFFCHSQFPEQQEIKHLHIILIVKMVKPLFLTILNESKNINNVYKEVFEDLIAYRYCRDHVSYDRLHARRGPRK